LKLVVVHNVKVGQLVAPRAGAWIETFRAPSG